MFFLFIFVIAILLSALLTFSIRAVALRFDIVDKPNKARKIHKKNIPLLGGTAIFASFFLILFFLKNYLVAGELNQFHWLGFFFGGVILIIGGFLDDKFDLSSKYQIFFPLLAIIMILIFGINIEKISNPLNGGVFYLNQWKIIFFSINFFILSSLLIFIWLLGMMYTTKLLDGLDGLVTGVTMIGSFIIFLFTMTDKYYQADIAMASLVLAGTCLGFLIFNWHPASIFLGEGGSLFLGYALGVLAIISGGKIAIALLVMGIPIMDVVWTIFRRLKKGQNPFKFSDREHLHFRLLDTGIGQRKTVLLYYFISFCFGFSALFLQSKGKILALSILLIIMFAVIYSFNKKNKKYYKFKI